MLPWIQVLALLFGWQVWERCVACLWTSLWKRLNQFSNGPRYKIWYTHINNCGRESLRLMVYPDLEVVCNYYRYWLLIFVLRFICWLPHLGLLFLWLEFLLHSSLVNSVETGGSWFVLAGLMRIGLQAMLRRGLLALRFGVWYLWSIPERWKLFMQDLCSKRFSDEMMGLFDSMDEGLNEEKSWMEFDSWKPTFSSAEGAENCFNVEFTERQCWRWWPFRRKSSVLMLAIISLGGCGEGCVMF
jgi:hypothetical protein